MRVSMEEEDLQRIADLVVRKLTPVLTNLRDAGRRPVVPEATPSQPAPNQSVVGKVVRRGELPLLTGLSMTTLWRLERAGDFPARIRLSSGRVGWRCFEVEGWLTARRMIS